MRRRRHQRTLYFDYVVAVLADEFGWDKTTSDLCRATLEHNDYSNGFPPWFEFICDNPMSANWRLKANPSAGKWMLRLSYYGRNPAVQTRAKRITQQIDG